MVTASARSLPALMCSTEDGRLSNISLHLSAEEIGQRRPGAAIRHVQHVDAGHHLEQLAGHVDRGSDAAGREVDLARIGLGVGDELGTLVAGTAGFTSITFGTRMMPATGAMSRTNVETELVVERRVDRVVRADHERACSRPAAT